LLFPDSTNNDKNLNTTKTLNTTIEENSINDNNDEQQQKMHLDTVGCVVMCLRTFNVASACSTGGLMMRRYGRVSHATQFGCGIWTKRWLVWFFL
jgi:isoaspartyl peptidase/L-asparaginase-like protein (Ntn-hydrolase superfamily)